MAKYEGNLNTDFDSFLKFIDNYILTGSMSASFEDGSDYEIDNLRCAIRVYERYSFAGGNRVSLNLTIIGNKEKLYFTAIASGGSQAVFLKINDIGEESFLDKFKAGINEYKSFL